MARKKESSTRDNVVSVRLDDSSIQAIDLLVQAGLAQSRSEGASQLINLGIQSGDALLQKAKFLAESVQKIKNEMIDAVKMRNIEKVKELLSKDESLANAQNEQGETAVLLSAYYHAKEIREMLLAKGPTLDLYEACAVGHTERIREILDAEPELVHVHNRDGYTPLGLASFFGHLETVKFLLTKNADVHQLSRDGQFNNTPLHAAIAGDHKEIVEILLKHGANVNARSEGAIRAGFTPLHVAAGKGNKEIASILLENGADINIKNEAGLTPAEYALQRGFKELADWLSLKK
jgi:ankyrin repeat protein